MDEIAWVLNLRGKDIPHNPLFCSFLILQFNKGKFLKGTLFIHFDKLTQEVEDYLKKNKIEVDDYDMFYECVSEL